MLVAFILAFIFSHPKDFGTLIPITILFPLFMVIYSMHSDQCSFISVMEEGLKITQPMKFRVVRLRWEDIHGYSTSIVRYGKGVGGTASHQSKTVIIYPKKSPPIELLQLYNPKLNKTFGSFRSRIKSLGGEPYDMGFFKRKYRFRVDNSGPPIG